MDELTLELYGALKATLSRVKDGVLARSIRGDTGLSCSIEQGTRLTKTLKEAWQTIERFEKERR